MFAGGEAGIESGSSQWVECQQDLGQDFVPCGEGKIGIGAAETSNEVVLEGSDGASAALRRCAPAGVCCKSMSSAQMCVLRASLASLSMRWRRGLRPRLVSLSWIDLQARVILDVWRVFMGSARMLLLSQSQMTMRHWLPEFEVARNLPVWSEQIWPLISCAWAHTRCEHGSLDLGWMSLSDSFGPAIWCGRGSLVLVDWMFLRC